MSPKVCFTGTGMAPGHCKNKPATYRVVNKKRIYLCAACEMYYEYILADEGMNV